MKRRTSSLLVSFALLLVVPVNAVAVDTPSPHPYSSAKPSKQTLTQVQKDAIAAARATFVAAKKNAQDGFDRAVADAQAIRDQAISSAGTDQGAIRLAKKNYWQSYKAILRAYKEDLINARSILAKGVAEVKTGDKVL